MKSWLMLSNDPITSELLSLQFGEGARHKPETLADLVEHSYIRSVPVDPFTKTADAWVPTQSEDSDAPGIVDVHSGATGAALNGTHFVEW